MVAQQDSLESILDEDFQAALKEIKVPLAKMLTNPLSVEDMYVRHPRVSITDDLPYNEYFLLRSWEILPSD